MSLANALDNTYQHVSIILQNNEHRITLVDLTSEKLLDYLRNREGKPRKKLILPPVIPWEYGSNKFASQKGTGGFGSPRNATVTIKSSKELSKSNDGVVPRLACPPLWDKELASQSGQTPFGKFREHVFKTQDIDSEVRQDINMLSYFKSESILKLWSRPNPDAKINKPFGHKRNEITESVGGRQFSAKELQASRAAIPRFQDPRNTIAAKAKKEQKKKDSFGNLIIPEPFAHLALQQPRIYKTLDSTSDGISMDLLSLNDEEGNQITAEQYMAWLGGQLTIQSTRGAEKQQRKSRNYASFYERLMSERTPTKREIREKLKKLQMEAKNNASAAKVSKADEDAQQMSSKYEQQDSHENESNNDQITKVLESNEKQSIKSESEINSSQKPHLTVTTTTTESNHTTMKQKANVPESLASDLSSNVANSVEYDSKNVNTYTNGSISNNDISSINENTLNNNTISNCNNNDSNSNSNNNNTCDITEAVSSNANSVITSKTLANAVNNNSIIVTNFE